MGRSPCCDKAKVKKGAWSPEEDEQLKQYIHKNGTGANWISLPQKAGLRRCGKSCRLRWLNYLRPNLKHGQFSDQEDTIICTLFSTIGSRWSVIAAQLPGRTDNDIKNYWNTKLKKKLTAIAPSTINYRKSPHHQDHNLLLQTSSMPSPYQCSTYNYITTPNIAFSRDNYNHDPILPNLTTLISPNVSSETLEALQSQDDECMGSLKNGNKFIASCNSSDGVDENLNFQSYFSNGEDPLDYDIEEIKQLISSTNYNLCNDNLNFFVDDMIKIEENVFD